MRARTYARTQMVDRIKYLIAHRSVHLLEEQLCELDPLQISRVSSMLKT